MSEPVKPIVEQLIRDVRQQLEVTYYREIQALQDNYPITQKLAEQMAYMALCEFRADLLGKQRREEESK